MYIYIIAIFYYLLYIAWHDMTHFLITKTLKLKAVYTGPAMRFCLSVRYLAKRSSLVNFSTISFTQGVSSFQSSMDLWENSSQQYSCEIWSHFTEDQTHFIPNSSGVP